MNKFNISTFTLCFCFLSMVSCQKSIDIPTIESNGYALSATIVETKTENAGLSTQWSNGDVLTVFHGASSSNNFSSNIFSLSNKNTGAFVCDAFDVTTLDSSNDWIAYYSDAREPFESGKIKFTIGASIQTQKGQNMNHIAGEICPLWGYSANVAKTEKPNLAMNNLAAVLDLIVTNNTKKALSLSKIQVKAHGKDLQGTFESTIKAGKPELSPITGQTLDKVELTTDLVLKAGEAGHLYLAVAPIEMQQGDILEITVGDCNKKVTLDKAISIKSGLVKEIPFSYDKDAKQKFDANSWLGDGLTFNDGVITIPGGNTARLNNPEFGTWNFHISNIQTTSMNVRFRFIFDNEKLHVNWGMWTDGSTDTWANMNMNWTFKPGGNDKQVPYKNEYTFTMKVVPSDKAGALDFEWSLDGKSYGTYTLIGADWQNDISNINAILIEATDSGSISLDWWEFEPYI